MKMVWRARSCPLWKLLHWRWISGQKVIWKVKAITIKTDSYRITHKMINSKTPGIPVTAGQLVMEWKPHTWLSCSYGYNRCADLQSTADNHGRANRPCVLKVPPRLVPRVHHSGTNLWCRNRSHVETLFLEESNNCRMRMLPWKRFYHRERNSRN